jgi:putative serine protease PepD
MNVETSLDQPYGPHQSGWQPEPERSRFSPKTQILALGAAVVLALGGGAAGAVGAVAFTGNGTSAAGPVTVSGVASSSSGSIASVAKAVQPAVVSITADSAAETATGSGIVIKSDGTILTNDHVVEGASSIKVKFSDGSTADAEVVGTKATNDLAVIKVSGVQNLTVATLGDSDSLVVGDPVLAIGSPLGLDGSVTSGIVSALNRTVAENEGATINGAIQTDAAINPGNSGGALVDGSGQVIGINTAIATNGTGSGSIGVGFAIPINQAQKIIEQIVSRSGNSTA